MAELYLYSVQAHLMSVVKIDMHIFYSHLFIFTFPYKYSLLMVNMNQLQIKEKYSSSPHFTVILLLYC